MGASSKANFEKSMDRLEEIVRILDSGERSLNESLELFEEGVRLARECSKQLADAKGRIEALVKQADGTFSEEGLEV
jgi:exodeoxyribonuclease VII small subunit